MAKNKPLSNRPSTAAQYRHLGRQYNDAATVAERSMTLRGLRTAATYRNLAEENHAAADEMERLSRLSVIGKVDLPLP